MTYDQHNFVVSVSAKAESMTARMNEVFEVKMALARHFLNNDHKFAIVSEDVVSNEQRLGAVCNLIVSVIPESEGTIAQIDEGHKIKTEIADVIWQLGYRCIIADEDMMSDLAKKKIQYLPKEGQYYERENDA
jgi:NTP pyrophosphatase (non-canonical NTP hydrolase)